MSNSNPLQATGSQNAEPRFIVSNSGAGSCAVDTTTGKHSAFYQHVSDAEEIARQMNAFPDSAVLACFHDPSSSLPLAPQPAAAKASIVRSPAMGDEKETTTGNPKSYIAWKETAERYEEALKTIRNMTDGHPINADRRDRIFTLANKALAA